MTDTSELAARRRVLDPLDRIIEAIFGLVMVLTFTCTLSAVESTRADVRTMMLAAVGCNVAWGLVDGVMYLFARVSQQMRNLDLLRSIRTAQAEEGSALLAGALPPRLAMVLAPAELDDLRARLARLPEQPGRVRITAEDLFGALGIFVIAVASVAPVLLPFVLMQEVHPAMRVSNAIALVMLFLLGEEWARLIGLPRWRVGVAMALGGAALVSLTIALGG